MPPTDDRSKLALYAEVEAELRTHFSMTRNITARLATSAAVLHQKFRGSFFWTGYYLLIDGELTIGPYEGSVACAVLPQHTGVCWAAIDRREPVVVANVHEFPGHIACDGRANSEIVVPLRDRDGAVLGVLDVDSADFESFNQVDVECLERILKMLSEA
jgi:GAF domain-containing protein